MAQMTIDDVIRDGLEYLQAAQAVVDIENPTDCAFIAFTCAQMAQAMILAKVAHPNCDDTIRVFAVDTGN